MSSHGESKMEEAGLTTATYWAPRLETIADIAFAIVIVALAVELVAGRVARRFERQIEAARELKIAELNNETAQLQKIVAGRQLDTKQATSVANALKRFAGRQIFISAYAGDAEGMRLALQLKKPIEDAGIVIADNEIGRAVVGEGMHGSYDLKFGVHMQAQDSERDFADAIAEVLDVYGKLKIEAISGPSQISPPHPTIGIVVGLRPL
jgi:hypothetical protein